MLSLLTLDNRRHGYGRSGKMSVLYPREYCQIRHHALLRRVRKCSGSGAIQPMTARCNLKYKAKYESEV